MHSSQFHEMRPVNRISLAILLAVISCVGRTAPAQPESPALGPEERYVWSIRASHADELLLPVGDSVDVVLLRDRCGADAGHGLKGCWDASTVDVAPRWQVAASGVARARPLPEGSWIFGRGAVVSDSLQVISAPGAVRILLEPKPATIVAGDTVRFRVTARDASDRIVAVLPLPLGWNVVGPPDGDGYAPVAFYPWETGGKLVPRLGRLTDTLELHFVARPKP